MSETTLPPRAWLITGSSSGLGHALATEVLARGHRVIATARDPATLSELAALHPETCRTLALDVTDAAQVKSVAARAVELFGCVDVLVNNAGRGLVGAFEELAPEEIALNLDTNFFGALEVIRQILPIMRAQQSGHIVNISAAAAISNYPGFSIYGAGKWALEGVSESLAEELKPLGIKVMIVQPGPFRTAFVGRSLVRAKAHLADYDKTSGRFQRLIESMDGKQPGLPDKAAAAIIAAIESSNPPLRLVLGKYANEKARRRHAQAERERAAWEHVGVSTDVDSAR